jgi:uncharacterized small protein (DUF1192 family)
MRDEDERRAGPAPLALSQADLELMGVGELEARIAVLKAQIAACEAMIAAKRAQRGAADALFSKPST